MSIEAIELMSERDRQAYADRLALEASRPILPPPKIVDRSLLPTPPPLVDSGDEQALPQKKQAAHPVSKKRARRRPTPVRAAMTAEPIPPFRPLFAPRKSEAPFERRQVNADAARAAAALYSED